MEILVTSLEKTRLERGMLMARQVAAKFVRNAYRSYKDTDG